MKGTKKIAAMAVLMLGLQVVPFTAFAAGNGWEYIFYSKEESKTVKNVNGVVSTEYSCVESGDKEAAQKFLNMFKGLFR
ncbi:MAG: hypothetical protein ACOX2X_03815 [Peptococcia bacterium]|jgi:hypothetical protein